MDYEEYDIPKYIKKKKSSLSKSKEKSKHKHKYVECLLIVDDRQPCRATYCQICGKIGDVNFFETEKTDHGIYRGLSEEEIFKKYMDFPQIHIKDIFQKYISIDGEKNK